MRGLKKLGAALALLVLLGTVLFYTTKFHFRGKFDFDTPYQAVLLDNGQSLYGKVERLSANYLELNDVYYVQQQVNGQTKEVKSVLVRRGAEWHGPKRTMINERHVIMMETVSPGSKVAELIAELNRKK